ncbi:MAG: tetratricopeptide repeat protein [Flavobacteriales bacterium]|jgi:tetratricopeptide (TPR) repeat protein|nr:tetratricopeptide repeat protein [Flavobacteriales bacterium]MCI1752302.1 tetratricopeptide repeat protein [Flavobacteriales bacterium]
MKLLKHVFILRAFLIVLVIGMAPRAMAQPGTDEQLALEYMRQGQYQKAILYLDKLYDKQPTAFYYEQLFKAYTGLKEFDDAEKLAKERMRRQNGDPVFLVDIGAVKKMEGDTAKAEQQFDKALKALPPEQAAVRNMANAFTKYNELGRALETYERGRKILKDGASDFFYETAALRAGQGDVPGMVSDYLDLLSTNPAYQQAVQNGLGRYIDFTATDDRSDLLRTELLRRIQKDPDNTSLQEMLIWLYLQRKDLNSAFVQSKAMDKRFKEDGERLMALGDMAVTNKDWSVAAKSYGYVAERGAGSPWYAAARAGLVQAKDAQVRDQADPPQEQLQELRTLYNSTLDELGRTPANVKLINGLAHLKAYYLNDAAGAVAELRQGITMPGLDRLEQGRLKLDLGDILVLQGEIWDASLLYSQVDLEMKQDVLGHEARLRNAKVSFYAGDFLWAKAQLDVLKASTSKLIANDAMELSLLIDDNLGTDTVSAALSLFAHVQLLTFQHKYDSALVQLDTLNARFPQSSLGDDMLYERYRIAHARHQYEEAAGYLQKVVELYPNDILVDNAMYDLGLLYENDIKDKEKAQEWFGKLLFDQSGSIFTADARDHYRNLRGDHDNLDTPEQKFLNGTP